MSFRRKKKCIRYLEGDDCDETAPGSAGSVEVSHDSDSDIDLPNHLAMTSTTPSPSVAAITDTAMASPSSSSLLLSPGPSLASPPGGPASLLLQSPASLASPLTPGDLAAIPPTLPQMGGQVATPPRPPVGTNPRDINNPLSVNQLTGQCAGGTKTDPPRQDNSHPAMVSVT